MKEEVKQPESGRTMVEMLGTLAIIGILTVGGVTGYGRAIVAHRANTAVETAQREAAIVAGDVATGQKVEPSNATVLRSPSGYEVAVRDVTGGTSDIVTTTPFFGVEVGGGNGQAVQRNVAKSIVERAVDDWTNVHGIGVISGDGGNRTIKWLTSSGTGTNGFESEVPENTQTVIIIVVYATDLSPRTGDLLTEFVLTPSGDDTTGCSTDIVKIRECDGSLTDCCPDTESCEQPTDCGCQSDSDCYGEQSCDNGECKCALDPELLAQIPSEWASQMAVGHLGTDGSTCCYFNPFAAMDGYYATETDVGTAAVCGCTSNATKYSTSTGPICCRENGIPGLDGHTCCFRGYKWDGFEGEYKSVDFQTCGCPDSGTLVSATAQYRLQGVEVDDSLKACCKGGYALSSGSYSGSYNVQVDLCE